MESISQALCDTKLNIILTRSDVITILLLAENTLKERLFDDPVNTEAALVVEQVDAVKRFRQAWHAARPVEVTQ